MEAGPCATARYWLRESAKRAHLALQGMRRLHVARRLRIPGRRAWSADWVRRPSTPSPERSFTSLEPQTTRDARE